MALSSFAVRQDGSIWEWGGNALGQLGSGTKTTVTVPTKLAAFKLWVDNDSNGIDDQWELAYFRCTGIDKNGDPDGDGLTNLEEYKAGTDPQKADTDGDGLSDRWEVTYPVVNPRLPDPSSADYDGDGVTNQVEQFYGTDPGKTDTDGDGVSDGAEIAQGSDPTNASDQGQAPNAEDKVTLTLKLGPGQYDLDRESDFQIYTMVITEIGQTKPLIQFICDAPEANGTAHTKTLTSSLFRRNKSYSVEIKASQPGASSTKDFDYHAYIEGGPYAIIDPPDPVAPHYGVLGAHEQDQDGTNPFPQQGKKAYLLGEEKGVR